MSNSHIPRGTSPSIIVADIPPGIFFPEVSHPLRVFLSESENSYLENLSGTTVMWSRRLEKVKENVKARKTGVNLKNNTV